MKSFHYKDKHTFFTLYKEYVRPQLECASSVWSPWLAGDIKMIEKVQGKALKITTGSKVKKNARRQGWKL